MFQYLFDLSPKKLWELPVERDFASEKAFNAARRPLLFQIFFRIRFFDIEVRFFGTAITKL
uniref:Ribosomal protein L32 n=1 Tax=Cucumis melo TaxID=3656 RepID=A0A894K7R7_CUCME|nr:ribosomal protein L32 [Cucumis melo]QRW36604.1 ribosomal protein L32 [Cucumis melo]